MKSSSTGAVAGAPSAPVAGQVGPGCDHGTAQQAIDFALDGNNAAWTQETEFLRAWREGDLDEWPEFHAWLAEQRVGASGTAPGGRITDPI